MFFWGVTVQVKLVGYCRYKMASKDDASYQSKDLPFPTPETATPSTPPLKYAMNNKRRGKAVIISNTEFDKKTGKGPRKESHNDAAYLYNIFKCRGFEIELCRDLKVAKMNEMFEKLSKEDHKDADCFLLAILSHAEDGYIYGKDGRMLLEECILPFKSGCESLAGKPKIFIFQTSLGDVIQSDAHEPPSEKFQEQMIPQQADVLMLCSTEPEPLKPGEEKKIRFVQAFNQVMSKRKPNQDFINVLTETNNRIAQDMAKKNAKVELPCIISTLTKKLIFHGK